MKYLYLLISTLTILTSSVYSQVNNTEIEYIQSKFGKDKKAIIADYVQLKTSDSFWDIYAKYEIKRKEIGRDRFNLTLYYANNQSAFSNGDLEKEIEKFISIKNDTDELIEDYYKIIKRKSGVKVASKFYMIERYFQNIVRINYMKQIPFMNELENKKDN